MAVAVKNTPDSTTRSGLSGLGLASVAGAIYVLGSIAIVTQAIPYLWRQGITSWLPQGLSFVGGAGLILVIVFAIGLLTVLGLSLAGPTPPRGLRAGVFTVLVWLGLTVMFSIWMGRLFGWMTGTPVVAMMAMAATAAGLLAFGWMLLHKPNATSSLEAFESQGWFSVMRYKPMQGLRVRRATMLGLLVLLGSGVWVLHSHQTLYSGAEHLTLTIPYFDIQIPVLPDIKITLPIILAAAAFWFSFRVVNWPIFADFLIATEAEVNKISWASRKSIVQDTIVVLATVLLLTIFLFVVDLSWGWILSRDFVNVLRVTPSQKDIAKPPDQIDW